MEPVSLFKLASDQARWLSVRQSTVSGNIANANTPGYKALEVEPFEKVLGNSNVHLASTQAGHIQPVSTQQSNYKVSEVEDAVVKPSENSVQLEEEMIKSGEVRRAFELNTAIVRSFHRMFTMTARS